MKHNATRQQGPSDSQPSQEFLLLDKVAFERESHVTLSSLSRLTSSKKNVRRLHRVLLHPAAIGEADNAASNVRHGANFEDFLSLKVRKDTGEGSMTEG